MGIETSQPIQTEQSQVVEGVDSPNRGEMTGPVDEGDIVDTVRGTDPADPVNQDPDKGADQASESDTARASGPSQQTQDPKAPTDSTGLNSGTDV